MVTNAPNIGNGSDITLVDAGGAAAIITDQGSNWVAFLMPASEIPGYKDILIQSATFGLTVLSKAYRMDSCAMDSCAVTIPNGVEVGKEAWLIGVPYTIRWTSAGTVSSQLKIEYSLNSGVTWSTIATNVPNAGSYSYWLTPAIQSDLCRVRITDMNDPTIGDISDSDFSLVQRFRVVAPNGGEKWYTGRDNTIWWMSAVGLGNLADIHYAPDGTNFTELVKFGAKNSPGSTNNSFVWSTHGNPALLSETGRIRVQTFGGTTGADTSDDYFTLAGIEITKPPAGALVNRRQTYPMEWVAAGAGPTVGVDFSANSGATWTNVMASYTNQPGTNTFDWNPAVQPTDTARLRVRSLSDTNIVGVSAGFIVAPRSEITGVAPTAGLYSGGYPVFITGTNLSTGTDVTNVTLCGIPAANIISQCATQIVITAGFSRPSRGDIIIHSALYHSTMMSNAFQYNPAITVDVSAHGTVVPNGVVEVFYGGRTNFAVTADPYCRIAALLVNAVSISAEIQKTGIVAVGSLR